jgi:hypothetical protein
MAVVLVSDGSVLIGLERDGFLSDVLALPAVLAVSDLFFKRELDSRGLSLVARGLRVLSLEPEGVALAMAYKPAAAPFRAAKAPPGPWRRPGRTSCSVAMHPCASSLARRVLSAVPWDGSSTGSGAIQTFAGTVRVRVEVEHINARVRAFQAARQPVISVDTNKKVLPSATPRRPAPTTGLEDVRSGSTTRRSRRPVIRQRRPL